MLADLVWPQWDDWSNQTLLHGAHPIASLQAQSCDDGRVQEGKYKCKPLLASCLVKSHWPKQVIGLSQEWGLGTLQSYLAMSLIHPERGKLRPCLISTSVPNWKTLLYLPPPSIPGYLLPFRYTLGVTFLVNLHRLKAGLYASPVSFPVVPYNFHYCSP